MRRLAVAATCVALLLQAPGVAAHANAGDLVQAAGFDQHLSHPVPPALAFRDDDGRDVRLGDYLGTVPVVLAFAYYGCSNLCPTVIGNLAHVLESTGLRPGAQYRVVVVSIDSRDSPPVAARRKVDYLQDAASGASGRAWHMLTGSGSSIDALTRAAGFRYAYDEATHQYAHPVGVLLLTPDGRIARYLLGFNFTPTELRGAIDDASGDRIAAPAQRLLLLCFHFDPAGKYSAAIIETLRWVAITMLATGLLLFAVRRRRAETMRQAR